MRSHFCFALAMGLVCAVFVQGEEPAAPPEDRLVGAGDAWLAALVDAGEGSREALSRQLAALLAREVDAARVAELVRELGSDAYAVRGSAAGALRALGAPVLPELRAALARDPDDAEVRYRLRVLIHEIAQAGQADRRAAVIKAANVLTALHRLDPQGTPERVLKVCDQGCVGAAYFFLRAMRPAAAKILEEAGRRAPGHAALAALSKVLPGDLAAALRAWRVREPLDVAAAMRGETKIVGVPAPEALFAQGAAGANGRNVKSDVPQYGFAPFLWDFTNAKPAQPICYDVDGDLWLDLTGTSYTVTGGEVDVIFVVRGNLYLTDDLTVPDSQAVRVTFLVRKRADGSGGNVVVGDPAYGTLERFDASFFAEGQILNNQLGEKTIRVNGLVEVAGEPGRDERLGLEPLPAERFRDEPAAFSLEQHPLLLQSSGK